MRLRWTRAAAEDLERIADYLFTKTPQHAPRLIRTLYRAPEVLKSFPNSGREGKKPGTRELVVQTMPYVFVYIITEGSVCIVRVLHSTQKWPDA